MLAHRLEDGSGLCFPSPLRPGRMLSDMTADEDTAFNGPCGAWDDTRVPHVVQDMEHGTDGYAVGGRGVGPGASARGQCRTGICPVRPVRPAPNAHAAVGRLRHGVVASSSTRRFAVGAARAEFSGCHRPGLYPDGDVAFLPPDGRVADPDRRRESSITLQPVDGGAAQSSKFLYFSTT